MQLVHFQSKVTAYIVSWFEVRQLQKLRRTQKNKMSFRDKQVLKRLVLHDVLFKGMEQLARCDQKSYY